MTSSERRSNRTSPRALLASAGLLACLLVAPSASAQRSAADIETARQAYNEGIALRDKGDLKGALEKFRAAHALGNTPITGLDLCRTYAVLGQPVEARETCLGVGRIPLQPAETARSQEARAEAARFADEVKTKIALVKLVVTNVPPGREPTVTVDGVEVPTVALGQTRSVNPGTHVAVAKVGRGGETRATFEAREGALQTIELAVQAPPPETQPVPANAGTPMPTPVRDGKKGSGVATFGWVVAGIGGAVGLVAGGVALSKKSDLADLCPGQKCGRDVHDELDGARSWGTLSTVAFVAGGVGLGIGLLGSLSGSSKTTGAAGAPASARTTRGPSATLDLGLGGARVHGTF